MSTGEAAAPAMAGATVAEAHSATADGVHRGAVSSRGNVRFSEQEPSTSQIQVDMDDMNDVPGMHSMHDRDEHMHESLLASSGGREASFGGSLRTPLSRVSKVRSVDGHGSVGAGVKFTMNILCTSQFEHQQRSHIFFLFCCIPQSRWVACSSSTPVCVSTWPCTCMEYCPNSASFRFDVRGNYLHNNNKTKTTRVLV